MEESLLISQVVSASAETRAKILKILIALKEEQVNTVSVRPHIGRPKGSTKRAERKTGYRFVKSVYTDDQIRKAFEMKEAGMTAREIAKELNMKMTYIGSDAMSIRLKKLADKMPATGLSKTF